MNKINFYHKKFCLIKHKHEKIIRVDNNNLQLN